MMSKQLIKYLSRHKIEQHAAMSGALRQALFVIIPAYLENSTLPGTILSLYQAQRENIPVNVIVVVNDSDTDSDESHQKSLALLEWCRSKAVELNDSAFRIIPIDAFRLNSKEKGAGLARKIGMDQVALFCKANDLDDAILVSLDADTLVADNYFIEIYRYFSDVSHQACTIHFEHRFDENLPTGCTDAIVLYELHLRYYKQALQAAGFPYSFHTVGSAIACRLTSYVKAGGMTRKQAGEDFYFIHKLVYLGGFGELTQTCVYPSSRPSLRVVFGTGATIQKWLDDQMSVYETYNLHSFIDLSALFLQAEAFYQLDEASYEKKILELPGRVRSFLVDQDFYREILPISSNCSTAAIFKKRFFEVFNAFRIIRYLNFVHEHFLAKMDVLEVAPLLLELNNKLNNPFANAHELLKIYRSIDQSGEHLTILK